MQYRRFGDTDLEVSEICFGPMRFAAREPGDDNVSKAGQQALARAIERGVNFIHSSHAYGTRWAMGKVLREHPKRKELHHMIKVEVPDFDDDGKFDAAKFRLRVEEALRDLYADRITVLQHLQRARPNANELRISHIEAVHPLMMETFEKLREEGKVGYLTTYPYTPGFAAVALKTGDFSGMVTYYNLIEMGMAEFFPDMHERGQGFFCIRPLMAGLLTDRRAERSRLPEGDRMLAESWNPAYERFEILKAALDGDAGRWTRFAIKFALIHSIVTSLIVGLNTTEQVDEVLDATDGDYPDQRVFHKALEIFRKYGAV